MQQYIARRLLYSIPVLLVVSVLVSGLIRLQPGDAVMAMMAEAGNIDPGTLNRIRAELGLDKPFHEQYVLWMWNLVRGDPGFSYWSGKPIMELWSMAIPITLELAFLAIVVSVIFAIPIGVLTAIRQDTWLDHLGRVFAISGLSLPDFWLGTLVIIFSGLYFKWVPKIEYVSPFTDLWGNLAQFALPAGILGFRLSATGMRMTRSTMLEVLREDYIRTAWAKGLKERAVVFRHALKNALIPVITILGTQLRLLLGGSVIMEVVFSLPGMGRLTYDAISGRDYGLVQGNVMFLALLAILLNLIVDLSYGWFDPRIRYN
ncbi:MAG: ABC transporter permease [Chloroflexi bacterium]|nr:ABC transporter permease [Chloroflexota bacterium]